MSDKYRSNIGQMQGRATPPLAPTPPPLYPPHQQRGSPLMPNPTPRRPLEGPSVWRGADLERSGDWVRGLTQTHCAELDAALRHITPATRRCSVTWRLSPPAHRRPARRHQRAGNRPRRRAPPGLPVHRYSENELRQLFWGIGCHLGTPLFQNMSGEIMGEVRDETKDTTPSFTRSEPGKVVSSRARARSTGPLRFHTDRCDVIALLCVRNAKAGGVTKLASIPTIHNEMLRRRPDLLEELCQRLLARPPERRGRSLRRTLLRAAGVRPARRQAHQPVFPHLRRAGAGIPQHPPAERRAEPSTRPARGHGG